MEAIASEPPGPAWKASLGLSTRRPPELYERSEQVGNAPHAGALRTAFDDLGLSAVFCVEHVPTVAILVGEYDRGAAASVHAALWNQGLASLLAVVSGETVRLFSLSRFPRDGDFDRCLVDELNAITDALTLRKLMARGKVLPALHGKTLHHGDFFAVAPDDAQADVVVGNPPWSSRRGERYSSLEWCKRERLPAPGREQAWPFVWKALRQLPDPDDLSEPQRSRSAADALIAAIEEQVRLAAENPHIAAE